MTRAAIREINRKDLTLEPPMNLNLCELCGRAARIEHWCGAAPTNAMKHLAVTGTVDGKNVNWMEQVSHAQHDAR